MNLEDFTKLIEKEIGETLLVKITDKKVYVAIDKNKIEDLYVKLNLCRSSLPLKDKYTPTFEEWKTENFIFKKGFSTYVSKATRVFYTENQLANSYERLKSNL
jgi:hypothetical protein